MYHELERIQGDKIVADGMPMTDPASDITTVRAELGVALRQSSNSLCFSALQYIDLFPCELASAEVSESPAIPIATVETTREGKSSLYGIVAVSSKGESSWNSPILRTQTT